MTEERLIDWQLEDELKPDYKGSRALNIPNNIRTNYGLRSIIRTQDIRNRVTYTSQWLDNDNKLCSISWRCIVKFEPEDELYDLEADFETKCEINNVDRVRTLVIWEQIFKDLIGSCFKIDYDERYTDEEIEELIKDNPEYGNGNAINIVQQQFNQKYPEYITCKVCGERANHGLLTHLIEIHPDYLKQYNLDDSNLTIPIAKKLPALIMIDQELRDRKWITVTDVVAGNDGKIIGIIDNIHERLVYVHSAFLFCKRCFYSGIEDSDHYKVFKNPVPDESVPKYIPELEYCPEGSHRNYLTIVKNPVTLFDFDIRDYENPHIKLRVTKCNEYSLQKDQYVVLDAREESSKDAKGRTTKYLRFNRVQILTEEIIRNVMGIDYKPALPEYSTIEDRIRKLVFGVHKSKAGTVLELSVVLEQVYNAHEDIRSSNIFKSTTTSDDNKPYRNFAQSLQKIRTDDDGRLERVGISPYKFIWTPTQQALATKIPI